MKTKNRFFKMVLMGLSLCMVIQSATPAFAFGNETAAEQYAQSEYGLSDISMDFLREHNVDLSVFQKEAACGVENNSSVVLSSMDESILSLKDETAAYGFTDEQIQKYVEGLVNSNPVTVIPSDTTVAVASNPTSSRIADGLGYEVKSNAGFYQSTAYVTLPTAYNAGSSNSWIFYTVSSANGWGIDVGIFYAYGSGGNGWRGCYTAQGSNTVAGSLLSELGPGSELYFNAKIEESGYLYFRILDAHDFSKEYYALRYYVGDHQIYRSNGIFNRQITMTSNLGLVFTNGSYIENAKFNKAYVYNSSGYTLTTASNTESSRRGAFGTNSTDVNQVYVNGYTPWSAEDISIYFVPA